MFDSSDVDTILDNLDEDDEDDAEEIEMLEEFKRDAETSEWGYGQGFIADSHFEDYARELAEDIGMTHSEESWPYTCIDWEQAATDLQMDYSSVELNGSTFWTR